MCRKVVAMVGEGGRRRRRGPASEQLRPKKQTFTSATSLSLLQPPNPHWRVVLEARWHAPGACGNEHRTRLRRTVGEGGGATAFLHASVLFLQGPSLPSSPPTLVLFLLNFSLNLLCVLPSAPPAAAVAAATSPATAVSPFFMQQTQQQRFLRSATQFPRFCRESRRSTPPPPPLLSKCAEILAEVFCRIQARSAKKREREQRSLSPLAQDTRDFFFSRSRLPSKYSLPPSPSFFVYSLPILLSFLLPVLLTLLP